MSNKMFKQKKNKNSKIYEIKTSKIINYRSNSSAIKTTTKFLTKTNYTMWQQSRQTKVDIF